VKLPSLRAILSGALDDISKGWKLRTLWIALATEDIDEQHRRTALGPLWLLLNYLLFVGTFLIIFGHSSSVPHFPAYVSIGMLIYLYIQELTLQAMSLFVREESLIAGTPLPLSVYVLRLTAQSLIRFAYALAGCVILLAITGIVWSGSSVISLLGLLNLVVATPAVIIVLAFVGAYFPDGQFIISNVMRLMMFLTPIFWTRGANQIIDALYHWNPLTHYIEAIRNPFVSGTAAANSVWSSVAITLSFWLLAIYFLGRYRKRIVFLL